MTGVEGHRSLEEASGGGRRLVGQLLDVGDARMVVDRHVDPVPAQATMRVTDPPSVHAVPAAGTDASELLGVEVQQLAGRGTLVADDGRTRLQPVESSQAMTPQQGIHRRATDAGLPGQPVRADALLAPQPTQLLGELGRVGAGLTAHHAATVDQADGPFAPVAVPPLRPGLAADAGGARRATHRPASGDALDQDRPASRGEAGVSMWHEGPFLRLWIPHQQPKDTGPQPVNNLIGN